MPLSGDRTPPPAGRCTAPTAPRPPSSCAGSPSGSPVSWPTPTSTSPPRRGPRRRGRERRGQVDADEDDVRHAPARRGDDPRRRRGACAALAERRHRAGIGMVHQHFMLADNLTVLENIVLGSEPAAGGRLDVASRRRIAELSRRYGLGLRPDEVAEDSPSPTASAWRSPRSSTAARAPSSSTSPPPCSSRRRSTRCSPRSPSSREGLAVVFISHKLDEVREVADRSPSSAAARPSARPPGRRRPASSPR